jgi:hypothetical protein
MLLSTILNLFFIPALYVILSAAMRKGKRRSAIAAKPGHIVAS